MKKILLVAQREFMATITTRGFVVGLLIVPAMIAVAALAAPRFFAARAPQVQGEIAVIDRTGAVAGELRNSLSPAGILERRRAAARRAVSQTMPGVDASAAEQALERVDPIPRFTVVERRADADIESEKQWLLGGRDDARRLALIVIGAPAVTRDASGTFGGYDLFVSPGLDDATESALFEGTRQALINTRLRRANLDPAGIDATVRVERPQAVIVAAGGEQRAVRGFTRALPLMLGVLMFVGVIMGGQGLMTATVEEKSSRVVEVLLAAVSPFELMAGKLLGQAVIGLLVLAVYVGLGFLALMSFAMVGLVDPMLVVYLVIFFLITYVLFSALMLAIGSAVNTMAEAQSLMGPVMILLLMPYMLSPMIARAPDSTFSVIASFVPPVNTFVMMSRLASNVPPPLWQVAITAIIGIAAACVAVWFAAKVFRVGLLMHGKPPNFATLVRWARQA
jgi:ABC-2 type transport system permease protein